MWPVLSVWYLTFSVSVPFGTVWYRWVLAFYFSSRFFCSEHFDLYHSCSPHTWWHRVSALKPLLACLCQFIKQTPPPCLPPFLPPSPLSKLTLFPNSGHKMRVGKQKSFCRSWTSSQGSETSLLPGRFSSASARRCAEAVGIFLEEGGVWSGGGALSTGCWK